MRRSQIVMALLATALTCGVGSAHAASKASRAAADSAFAKETKTAARRAGLVPTWLDAKAGKVMLELPRPTGPRLECGRFLYLEGIRTGLGSNAVGLDRGQGGDARVVTFRRVGARLLIEQPNLRYRAQSSDSNEVRAVEESFAVSVLWAGEIAAETTDGRLLVDLTSFVVRDAHRTVAALKAAGQGSFKLDKDRSVLDPTRCASFPDNLEFEALLTFTSDEPGAEVRATAPTPEAIGIVQRHSLVRLPDDGYRPRRWDPRSGSFAILFSDYARPLDADIDVRWLVRHRLEKLDPSAPRSRVKKPIVYYVDAGTPEPVRSALVEGASWWAAAFEAAGFIDAFQVRLLPEGADPLDVRYNVIQWVHRSTRGWSYGGGVIDPRSGEMIKGQISLGSLRIRQDRMIFEGLAGVANTGSGTADDPVQLGLARIRQLAAHEVGHALGFRHNFAASSYAGRASVMDYPAPLVGVLPDGTLDFSSAYASGIGAWDIQQVRYAYGEFPPGSDEQAALAAILRENRERGYLFLSDPDTRPAGAAHPLAAMWDNGSDPVAQLVHTMTVRRIALARFGERNLTPGSPLGELAAVLAPLYFHHRYAVAAAAKSIAGLEYGYTVRGDGEPPARPVPAARQRAALAALLATLDPAALDLPDALIERLVPAAVDYTRRYEFFESSTRPAFDALGAAGTAAGMTLDELLVAERLARLVDFQRRDRAAFGIAELLDALIERIASEAREPRLAEIHRTVQAVAVRRLVAAAANPKQTSAVRAALENALAKLGDKLGAGRGATPGDRQLRAMLSRDIARFLSGPGAARPLDTAGGASLEPPAGPPIGMPDECGWSRAVE